MVYLFEEHIQKKIDKMPFAYIDINAGDVHRAVGGYPSSNHRMPVCCQTMRKLMNGTDEIVQSPPKGNGSLLTIRYYKQNH